MERHGENQPYFDVSRQQWFVNRPGERQVFFNDGDICVWAVQRHGDLRVDFRAVVRLDTTDTENPDTPLSREEFLAKYPLHQSLIDFPDANPRTRAMCRCFANNYHAHEKEYLTLSAVEKIRILNPPEEGEMASVKVEELSDRQRIGIGISNEEKEVVVPEKLPKLSFTSAIQGASAVRGKLIEDTGENKESIVANFAYDDNDAFSVRLRIDDSLSLESIQPGYEILAQKVKERSDLLFFMQKLRRSIWFLRSGDSRIDPSAFDDGHEEEREKKWRKEFEESRKKKFPEMSPEPAGTPTLHGRKIENGPEDKDSVVAVL
ncbi:MAG: hypothetical protein P4N24_15710 [Acidobacteriota bacterium]|nr:hypothetical protein [Acidobacteriota bacterium]